MVVGGRVPTIDHSVRVAMATAGAALVLGIVGSPLSVGPTRRARLPHGIAAALGGTLRVGRRGGGGKGVERCGRRGGRRGEGRRGAREEGREGGGKGGEEEGGGVRENSRLSEREVKVHVHVRM